MLNVLYLVGARLVREVIKASVIAGLYWLLVYLMPRYGPTSAALSACRPDCYLTRCPMASTCTPSGSAWVCRWSFPPRGS